MPQQYNLDKIKNNLATIDARLFNTLIKLGASLYSIQVKELPFYEALGKTGNDMFKYIEEIDKIEPGSKEAMDLMGRLYRFMKVDVKNMMTQISKYKNKRANIKTESSKYIEESVDGVLAMYNDIAETESIVAKNYQYLHNLYKGNRLSEVKPKPKRSLGTETKLLMAVLILSIAFVGLSFSGIQNMETTGYSALPTGDFVSGFELLYVLVSAAVISVYGIGKLAKRW